MKKVILALSFFIFLVCDAPAYQAEVHNIPSEKYFEVTLNEITSARESIMVYLYLVSTGGNQKQPGQLLEALVKAKKRGVDVSVVLDQNHMEFKNERAFETLKNGGVDVYFDDPARRTHSKAVIIDRRTVILGSTNWTQSGLMRNVESNLLVRSESLARDILNDLDKIQRRGPAFEIGSKTDVPQAFLTGEKFLGIMVTRGDERAFDIYLYLLKEYDGNSEGQITLDYDRLAQSLGIENMGKEAYRRQIIKVLEKLEKEYRLIGFRPVYGKDAQIILKNYESPSKLYRAPKEEFFQIPVTFWDWGWNRSLSFSGKVVYFLNLLYSASSKNPPQWQIPVKTLSERHHVSEWFISEGTTALRRADLVEVKYATYEAENEKPREPSIYLPNPLYDPKERVKKLKILKNRFGIEKLERAKSAATAVYEDSDVNGIEMLIGLENTYGAKIVGEAVKIVSLKDAGNPRRSMAYLINAVKGMGEKER